VGSELTRQFARAQQTRAPEESMGLKSMVKTAVLGRPGNRPRDIQRGLLRGLKFHVDTASKSMRLLGLDEREIAAAVRDAASHAAAALDVGANDGWYALYFASRPNIERVWAFEPEEGLLDGLRGNFALNPPEFFEKIQIEQKFVGDRDEERFCRIDTVVGDYAKPLVIKIDVEGAEVDVLKGARRTLERNDCHLVIETHGREFEQGCVELLKGLNYQTTIIDVGWYRSIVPEDRTTANLRWLTARRRG
jgi:hypothetical protein